MSDFSVMTREEEIYLYFKLQTLIDFAKQIAAIGEIHLPNTTERILGSKAIEILEQIGEKYEED